MRASLCQLAELIAAEGELLSSRRGHRAGAANCPRNVCGPTMPNFASGCDAVAWIQLSSSEPNNAPIWYQRTGEVFSEVGLSGFDNASADQAFNRNEPLSPLARKTT